MANFAFGFLIGVVFTIMFIVVMCACYSAGKDEKEDGRNDKR